MFDVSFWLALSALALSPAPVPEQPARPAFSLDRSEENWEGFRTAAPDDFSDRLKYLPFGKNGSFLTLAGDLRGVFELYDHSGWGLGPEDNDGYLLHRLMFSADVHWGRQARVFFELRSGESYGREGGPRPSQDQDTLDISQLFFGWQTAKNSGEPLLELKVGRQELNYGEGTLLAIRDLNVRRTFDGVKLIVRPKEPWRFDLLAFQPAQIKVGSFDDGFDDTQSLWGIWAQRPFSDRPFLTKVEVYFLNLERDRATYRQGAAGERRRTLGINLHGRRGAFSTFTELDLQVGDFADGKIRAWKYAQRLSWTYPERRFSPTIRLQGAISSGDQDPADPDLETFHPLFPRGLYYGRLDSSGSLNAVVVHPEISLKVAASLTLGASIFWFRRQSRDDGLYSQPGFLLRSGADLNDREVGRLHELALRWQKNRHTIVEVLVATYEVGEFLRRSAPAGRDMSFFSLIWQYKF